MSGDGDLNWKTNEALAVGKGATVEQFLATFAGHRFEIDVAPCGEGFSRSQEDRRALRTGAGA